MKLTYDRGLNVAYLRLRPAGTGIRTIQVNPELNVDLAPDGRVCGIEFLNANEQLGRTDDGRLVLHDATTGTETSLPLRPAAAE
jgi:uncharacterized protein YuzE